MVRRIDAVFEEGVLRPLEPLDLDEHQHVRVTLDDRRPRPRVSLRAEYNDRHEEMEWLATEAGPYAGQWVALSGKRLVAHGPDAAAVRAEARAVGVERPLLTHLPGKNELPFGGW